MARVGAVRTLRSGSAKWFYVPMCKPRFGREGWGEGRGIRNGPWLVANKRGALPATTAKDESRSIAALDLGFALAANVRLRFSE